MAHPGDYSGADSPRTLPALSPRRRHVEHQVYFPPSFASLLLNSLFLIDCFKLLTSCQPIVTPLHMDQPLHPEPPHSPRSPHSPHPPGAGSQSPRAKPRGSQSPRAKPRGDQSPAVALAQAVRAQAAVRREERRQAAALAQVMHSP